MKKNILLVMVMMLMTAVNALAQKEYNMVITLNNGTTVTLGHNDIKEITFNDGEIAISGNMVNTIDSLAGVTKSLDDKIFEVANEYINQLLNFVDGRFADYADAINSIVAFMEAQDALNEQQATVNEQLMTSIGQIVYFMEKLHPELAGAPEIKRAKSISANASTADMKTAIENLKKALENINKK
ncbi:MAG: hypothetical protein Q4D51_14775 [Eubacteriales bacterium]|nr:hypothetical protein [Eubacteriales bacterium]